MQEVQAFIVANWIPVAVVAAVLVILLLWLITRKRGQRVVLDIDTSRTSGLAARPLSNEELGIRVVNDPVPVLQVTDGDDLTRIKGVGPRIVGLLHGMGVTRYAQIAAWTDADLAAVDARLGTFAGRPAKDQWIAQCTLLAADDKASFETAFGALGNEKA